MAELLTKTLHKTQMIQTKILSRFWACLGCVLRCSDRTDLRTVNQQLVEWPCSNSVGRGKLNPQECNQTPLRNFDPTKCHLNEKIACLDAPMSSRLQID